MATHVVNVDDLPDLEEVITANIDHRRGTGIGDTQQKSTRFLGQPDDDVLNPQKPPFAFYIHRPTGDVTPEHSHGANRIEFVISGRISFHERGKEPVEYGPGTLTYVEARTVYGYKVLEDATILIVFEGKPQVGIGGAARGSF